MMEVELFSQMFWRLVGIASLVISLNWLFNGRKGAKKEWRGPWSL